MDAGKRFLQPVLVTGVDLHEVALIGAGSMGEAMLRGWLESGAVDGENVVVSDRDDTKADLLKERYGVDKAPGNREATVDSKMVVLAVKPKDSFEVMEELSTVIGDRTSVLSIVAGLKLDTMRKLLGKRPPLVRVMPNMAASVQSAISVFTVDPGYGKLDREMVLELLEAIGNAVEVDEKYMDLATAISGSGPAYFFLLVELLEKAGVKEGMPPDMSRELARETLWGAARVLKMTGKEAAVLREAVSSPGGTTVAALEVLYDEGFEKIVLAAVRAARDRAGELAR